MFDFIKNVSPTELVIIILVLLILFGSRVMLKMARTSGETIKEIKKIKSGFTQAIEGEDKPSKK